MYTCSAYKSREEERKNDKIAPWNRWNPWEHSFHSWHSIFLFKFMQISIYVLRWFYYFCCLKRIIRQLDKRIFPRRMCVPHVRVLFLHCIWNFVQHLFAIVERRWKCENWIRTQQKPLPRTKMHKWCSQMNMLSHLNKSSACATKTQMQRLTHF